MRKYLINCVSMNAMYGLVNRDSNWAFGRLDVSKSMSSIDRKNRDIVLLHFELSACY